MKKIINKICLSAILLLLMFSNINTVYAWYTPSNNKTSLSVGATYSDGVSSVDNANDAYNTYNAMGLTSKKITSTTSVNITGSHSNGVPYLQSGIVYLNGHANSELMEFSNSILITKSSSISGTNIGIGYYDNTKTALIEFAGCQTANGTNNITKYGNDQGANITIGWTTDLNVSSFVNWNKRFNDNIQTKTTSVNDSASSASNHIYLSNTVKNYKVYGSGGYNPWYWITGSTSLSSAKTSNLRDNEYIINNMREINYFETADINMINNVIFEFIRNNISGDFDYRNYKVEVNGNDVKYYDYVLYINDIRTNLGYTVSINKDNEIHLYDNMSHINEKEATTEIATSATKFSKLSKNNYNKLSIEKSLLEQELSKSEIIDEFKYYDFENKKSIYVVEVKNTTQSGTNIVKFYEYEL